MNSKCMNFAAIQHTPDNIFAYPVNLNTLCIRIKTAKDDCVKACIRYKNIYDHVSPPVRQKMDLVSSDAYNDYFETEITESGKRFKYYFELTDLSGNIWNFSCSGFTPYDECFNEYFFYPYLFEEDVPTPPIWLKEGMIYQIFIDRFCNGDLSNDPENCLAWDSLPVSESFYGGDFKGITEKMEYIASLGTTILYVNPVFLSDSNHKYDTIDYYRIDPAFGTVEQACEMVQQAHRFGIRVLLDAVFNHCSNKNQLFLDVVEKGDKSRYYDWFCVNGPKVEMAPHNYDSFADQVPEMPRLNTSNPLVQDYLIDASIYWTQLLDIDGWRLDVADEVSHVLWRKFRAGLRNVKPDIYILGEVWNRATPWLLGDEFDSVTNYKFRKALLSMAVNGSRTNLDFWNEMCGNEMNYRSTSLPYMVNLVSSHDVKRILTELSGNKQAVRPIFGILFTYPGIPLMYYGDEIGIEGGEDPDNRRTMKWDGKDQDTDLLGFVRKLGRYRKTTDAILHGKVKQVTCVPARVVGYERSFDPKAASVLSSKSKRSEVLVFANFGREGCSLCISSQLVSTSNPTVLRSCLDDRLFYPDGSGSFEIKLNGYDFIVLENG